MSDSPQQNGRAGSAWRVADWRDGGMSADLDASDQLSRLAHPLAMISCILRAALAGLQHLWRALRGLLDRGNG